MVDRTADVRTWHDGGHSCRGARGERVSLCYYATDCVFVRARGGGGGGGGGERGAVAGAVRVRVRRWAVCLLLAGECCEGRRWFCLWPRQIGCLPFPEQGTDRDRDREATGITPPLGDGQPVGAYLLACLRCFALMAAAGREQE